MAGRWSTSTFRQWLGLDLSYFTSSLWSSPVSVLRWWPSHLTANPSSWWVTRRLLRWPELDFSIVDDAERKFLLVARKFLGCTWCCCRRKVTSARGGRTVAGSNNMVVLGLL
ncbi:hypothetical protein OIU84_018158 [Salix udensis]|uniref:Uncharacterized protein n=1 Tax=Salix udensis TaxID=889485 RepID=A0AAD6L3J5_9ROSI|nr:hypothetical protein OIU84_018158 [Salix udensis]